MPENLPHTRGFTRRRVIAAGLGLVGTGLGLATFYDAVTAPREEGSSAYNPGSATSVLPKNEAIGEQNRLTDSRAILRVSGGVVAAALIAYSIDGLTTG